MNAKFKINGDVLESKRLILRPFKETDLEDFYLYAKEDGVGEMAGWCHHKSIEESKMILDMFINEDKTFAIVNKENNKVIGSLGVELYNEKEIELNNYKGREIGYVLSKDYWGLGLMPEAVKLVIDYLFNTKDLDFLVAGYFLFNNQSKRVQEKLGFKPYKESKYKTRLNTIEDCMLSLLINPKKNINI